MGRCRWTASLPFSSASAAAGCRNMHTVKKMLRSFPFLSCHLPCSLIESAHGNFDFSVFIGHRKIGESTW